MRDLWRGRRGRARRWALVALVAGAASGCDGPPAPAASSAAGAAPAAPRRGAPAGSPVDPAPRVAGAAGAPVGGAGAPAATAGLPGTLWYAEGDAHGHAGGALVRWTAGERREVRVPDAGLYPSPWVLPDGRLVAIASRGDGSAGAEQLALVAPDGAVTRIGPAAATVRSPAVDPRGRWIIAAVNADGKSRLHRVALPGGQVTPLPSAARGDFDPVRIAGGAIAFASSRDGNSELYRMPAMPAMPARPAPGGAPQRLTAFHRDDWGPVASPDGEELAFLSDREGRARIFVMRSDGTGLRRLTAATATDRDEAAPAWAPDGRAIAYVVEGGGESTVRIRALAGGPELPLTPPGMRDADPCFSPDGAWLAVARGRGARDADIWAIPVAAAGPPVQISTAAGPERLPRWVP